MVAPVQTLQLDVHYSIFRRIISPTLRSPVGGGARQVRRQYQRPVYEFTLKASHENYGQAQYLMSFAQYHLGDIPFFWSGEIWGAVGTGFPVLFGFGDGVRTQFFLNNRNILGSPTGLVAPAIDIYIAGVLQAPQPQVDLAVGLVTFPMAPADQAALKAAHQCRYKCVFHMPDEVLLSEELFYQQLYKFEGIIIREVIP